MQESPDLRSVNTIKQLIRILNSLHEECISRDLRSGSEGSDLTIVIIQKFSYTSHGAINVS